ncbi:MAG: D-alanine--D-alanine ligase [Actinomycetota bacterium]
MRRHDASRRDSRNDLGLDAHAATLVASTVQPMTAGAERTTLVVLFGGRSAEHDVSCVTAVHVMRAVDPARYRVLAYAIDRDGTWRRPQIATVADGSIDVTALPDRLEASGEVVGPGSFDVDASTVVVPLLHGPLGEDGTLQGLLEMLGVAYVGSGVLASAAAMDKAVAKRLLADAGIAQVRHAVLRDDQTDEATLVSVAADLGWPVFVKPANMGSSVGVSKARDLTELAEAVRVASRYDEWILVEEAVEGREIEVAVIGNRSPRASLPGEIVPGHEFYDYDDKYLDDGARLSTPASLAPAAVDEVRALAVRAFDALRCEGMARVDFFFEENGRGFLCNEVNTIPGFTPISMYPRMWAATGLDYPSLIDELVALAVERHARRRRDTSR